MTFFLKRNSLSPPQYISLPSNKFIFSTVSSTCKYTRRNRGMCSQGFISTIVEGWEVEG